MVSYKINLLKKYKKLYRWGLSLLVHRNNWHLYMTGMHKETWNFVDS